MDRIPLIHNPASGGGRGRIKFREAEALLAVKGVEVEPIETQYPRHASEIARRLAEEGHKTVFLLGGDGTFSEAVNGIMELPKRSRPTFGIIPSGTGNDFLRDFEITELAQGVDHVARGHARPMDVGRFVDGEGETRWSINIFGTGFAAAAADLTNRKLKWIGRQAYNTAVLVKLAGLKPTPTRLVLDGKERTGDYPLVMVCNTIHTGGAMKMAPMARPDDGWLDVLTVEGLSRRQLLGLLVKLKDGTHIHHRKVTMERAKKITIEPEAPSPLLADGEVLGVTPTTITVDPGAIKVLL